MLHVIAFAMSLVLTNAIVALHNTNHTIVVRHDDQKKQTYILVEKRDNACRPPTDYTLYHKTDIMQDCAILGDLPISKSKVLLAHADHSSLSNDSNCLWLNLSDVIMRYRTQQQPFLFLTNPPIQRDKHPAHTIAQEKRSFKELRQLLCINQIIGIPAYRYNVYTTGILCISVNYYGLFHVLLKKLPHKNTYTIPTHMYNPSSKNASVVAYQALAAKTDHGFGQTVQEHDAYIQGRVNIQPWITTYTKEANTQINVQSIFPAYIPDIQSFTKKEVTLPNEWIPIKNIYAHEINPNAQHDDVPLAPATRAFFSEYRHQLITFIAMHVVKEKDESALLSMEK